MLPMSWALLEYPSLTSMESSEHSEFAPLIPVNTRNRSDMYRSVGTLMRQTQSENAGKDIG